MSYQLRAIRKLCQDTCPTPVCYIPAYHCLQKVDLMLNALIQLKIIQFDDGSGHDVGM